MKRNAYEKPILSRSVALAGVTADITKILSITLPEPPPPPPP